VSEHGPPHDPKWRRLPGERPTQLIEAALEVFSEHGYNAAKLDEIAHRAGVSKGTIYLYFASKEELFQAVVRDIIAAQLQSAHEGPVARSSSDALERALRAQWAFTTNPRFDAWFRILIAELPKHPDLLGFYNREVIDRAWAILEAIVAKGVASGEFRAIEPRLAVGFANSLVIMHRHWVSTNSIRPEYQSRDRQQLIDGIVDFALAALRSPAYQRIAV
jgi:AcrR family transcriptional regulator